MTYPTIYCLLFIVILWHESQKLKASLTAKSIFLYLQRCKAWIHVKPVFFVDIFLLKLYPTRKAVHILTIFWYNSKIASIYSFLILVYLQVMKNNTLYCQRLQHFEKKGSISLMFKTGIMTTLKKQTSDMFLFLLLLLLLLLLFVTLVE